MKKRMDFFGIYAGIQGAALTYIQAARATGRTTSLIEALGPNDRVICATEHQANALINAARKLGKSPKVIVVKPTDPDLGAHILPRTAPGRTVFDHAWVEEFYLQAIDQARDWIAGAEQAMSGTEEPHQETRIKARERSKWSDRRMI